jgi:L-alanine-DL-glutamate epimerase-like enolase superfamily enzyme
MPKPGRTGISEALEIDALCARQGAAVSLGMYYESALGASLTLQAAAALKSRLILPLECFFPMLSEQVILALPEIRDGRLRLPDEADLSKLIDWTAVKRFAL